MPQDRHLILYHSPRSRSRGARMLLEALGADYEVRAFDLTTGQHRSPEFLAINPVHKVPTLQHGDAIITEQVAVYLYAAELYPEAGLSPAVGDPLRGPYLRWMAFYGASFDAGHCRSLHEARARGVFAFAVWRLRYRHQDADRAVGTRPVSAG